MKNKFYTAAIPLALVLITISGAVLRLTNLGEFDFTVEEDLYAMRAVGYLDYIYSPTQITPVQAFENQQWWQKFSFHDSPPLSFFIQHIFFKIFGDTIFIARLPYALFGTVSIILMFILGSSLYSKKFGLLSAALAAVSNYSVWTSRISLLETFVIFFTLLTLISIVKAIKGQEEYLIGVGVFIGLGLLSKYTALVLLPLSFFIILFSKKELFKSRRLYGGMLLFFIIISPLIIYNVNYYLTRGHFDAALSSLVGAQPDDFKGLKRNYEGIPGFAAVYFIFERSENLFFSLFALMGLFLLMLNKFLPSKFPKLLVTAVLLYFASTLLVFFGSSAPRFISLVSPAWVLLASAAIMYLYQIYKYKRIITVLTFIAVCYFFLVAYNSQVLALEPFSTQPILFQKPLRGLENNYYHLDNWLEDFFYTQKPIIPFKEPPFKMPVPQLNRLAEKKEMLVKSRLGNQGLSPEMAFVFYDDRMQYTHVRWIFWRRAFNELRPILSFQELAFVLTASGPDFFEKTGFDSYYFIFTAIDKSEIENHHSVQIMKLLDEAGYKPYTTIRNLQNRPLFIIYKTNTLSFLFSNG
ncbi:MAG: hypothetical protein A3J59_04990 [Candidatus Buchananbacteria bacterium RIFCSPHIGHO2_02_FULL_56_16]|uniref:Glycosyltransferase RgtA/B/C/D-like domain-containing protein n=1 Tax=Candidatus Buchananbacteria bacterium RIFCSPHIGHO2_02_FULL_56_16 TaxID=1797542 RepID=A0A1G1YH30_9BACT|nr:MAG: hypothetical protein A3J59_04990 [Candidatus Buchananbacteria bacterium RIFCSPHIGHO2_02_FULL_56_16]